MIIFGGYDGSGVVNDTYSLNLSSNAWTQITTSGSSPASRYGHSAVLYNGDQMIIFGGHDGSSYFNDTYSLGDFGGMMCGCTACAAGKYANTTGSATCTDCAVGKYNANTSSTAASACIDCPAGHTTLSAGSSQCNVCEAGYAESSVPALSAACGSVSFPWTQITTSGSTPAGVMVIVLCCTMEIR